MPDDGEDQKQAELALGGDGAIAAEPVLPPVVPPTTKTPFQFNQQINIQQIPSRAWEKLSADQIVDLTKTIVNQIENLMNVNSTGLSSRPKAHRLPNGWLCVSVA